MHRNSIFTSNNPDILQTMLIQSVRDFLISVQTSSFPGIRETRIILD